MTLQGEGIQYTTGVRWSTEHGFTEWRCPECGGQCFWHYVDATYDVQFCDACGATTGERILLAPGSITTGGKAQ